MGDGDLIFNGNLWWASFFPSHEEFVVKVEDQHHSHAIISNMSHVTPTILEHFLPYMVNVSGIIDKPKFCMDTYCTIRWRKGY